MPVKRVFSYFRCFIARSVITNSNRNGNPFLTRNSGYLLINILSPIITPTFGVPSNCLSWCNVSILISEGLSITFFLSNSQRPQLERFLKIGFGLHFNYYKVEASAEDSTSCSYQLARSLALWLMSYPLCFKRST